VTDPYEGFPSDRPIRGVSIRVTTSQRDPVLSTVHTYMNTRIHTHYTCLHICKLVRCSSIWRIEQNRCILCSLSRGVLYFFFVSAHVTMCTYGLGKILATYICIYIYTYTHTHMHIHIHVYINTCIHTYIHTYTYIYICIYTHIHSHTHHTYTCICIHKLPRNTYICIHILHPSACY